ncbi:protein ECT2 isoform X1 [Diabrotica undecimpunctata]|uniref:protein ECT2 isoform X1 n=1 Tax=Diabrotica undecimpunctata TaxID=50387 RepID=UPI003B637841
MDEVRAPIIYNQGSVCSDSNGDDVSRNDVSSQSNLRLCLVGSVASDSDVYNVAQSFALPIVTSKDGQEYTQDDSCTTIYVVKEFDGDVFNVLFKSKQQILGSVALKQLAVKKEKIPCNTRPLYNLAMTGVIVCFTGFREKEELAKLVTLLHHMGGSIRKDMSSKVTHLIANVSGGDKYQYAATFRVPVMNPSWVVDSWQRRDDLNFTGIIEEHVAKHKLKPFHGARVGFVGFAEEEEKHMSEVLLLNGGVVTSVDDVNCTHVVMEHAEIYTLEAASAPLSPKVSSPPSRSKTPKTPSYSNVVNSNMSLSNCFKVNQSLACLETLHENSGDNNLEDFDIGFDQSFDPNITPHKRKRKFNSPDQSSILVKRKRDKSYSERKRKVSEFFKTPINYFSNRRRTIDASSLNQSLSESVISSSGIFNVETVQNLSSYNDNTPQNSKKGLKKNLFTRTFSSSKFRRTKKNIDLNATKLSFGEACDVEGREKLNATCFPDISLNPITTNTYELSSEHARASRRTSVSAVAVVDESTVTERPEAPSKVWIVKAEWFWTSVQKETSLPEKDYLFDDYLDQVLSPSGRRDSSATPGSAARRRKRKLLLSSLVHNQSPALTKRRSSVSDAGLLSVSGSFLDCTTSPNKEIIDGAEPVIDTPRKGLTQRHQVFLELLQTETNYVDILHTIVTMFKKHLEEMPEQEALLNNTELNLIFGKLPFIYETHIKMLDEIRWTAAHWSEDLSIGNIVVKYSSELQRAYPPFINYFEEMKEVLCQCDQNKPRFHAFLKACQTRAECGRQSLQELMIRPVQRLGSISLLLNDILKNTPKTNPDHSALEQALAVLREVMTHINEDKRKAEGQVTLFNIFNDIDNCPPDIVSSHRNFVAKAEVVQLSSSEGLASKGNNLVLFLFSDQLEVCKKKSKAFNSLKSPSTVTTAGVGGSLQNRQLIKPYKHIRLMALNTIKRVIDIKETDECQKVFSLVCRNNDDLKEKLYSFAMADEEADKVQFLKTLTRQMANNACTADADKFMAYLEPQQLDIDTSDVNNGTFSKAIKFATNRFKVGRAFSFNKTPSKLKRAVSSMMSPFGSSTNLTPASQLAQMKLASYSNINELGNAENSNESQPVAPMSVQPTRKMKSSSLGSNALKRL